MADLILKLLTAVGGLAVVAAALVGGAYWLFRLFAEKWLSARFDRQLEDLKHAQQKEVEELRYKINALLDRAVKLHQHEFEVLPEAWSKLNDAFGAVLTAISQIQTYSDIDQMSDVQLRSFLDSSELDEWERHELLSRTKKNDYYAECISWRRLTQAQQAARDNHIFLRKNGIFILPSIKQQFDAIDELLWAATVEHEINLKMKLVPRLIDKIDAARKGADALMQHLSRDVQARLWNAEAGKQHDGG